VVLSLIGFLRWVFVVPPLAHSYVTSDATTQAAVAAAWTAQHQFGGVLLGEHLGQLLVIGWSVTLCAIIVRTRVLPRWLGVTGLAVSALYLLNQGDILATAVPGFPVWALVGPIGSTGWGVWVAALGVTVLLRPATRLATAGPGAEHRISTRSPPGPDTAHTRPPLTDSRSEYELNTNGGHPMTTETSATRNRTGKAARPTPGQTRGDLRRFNANGWLLWTAGFVSFPLAGVAAQAATGRINDAVAALAGG
jgi:Domain of unknown function (DUF4386)